MSGRALNSREYTARPSASNPTARAAWDFFLREEGREQPTYIYGNEGTRGVVTNGPKAPARHRKPVTMVRSFMDYWCWLMKFEDGEFEEVECRTIQLQMRRQARASA